MAESGAGPWDVVLYDVTAGTPSGVTLKHSTIVDHVALSDDGTRLATLGRKKIPTQMPKRSAMTREQKEQGREDLGAGVLCIWDASTGDLIARTEQPRTTLIQAEFVPNSTLVVTQSISPPPKHESHFVIWDYVGGELTVKARVTLKAMSRKMIVSSDNSSILLVEAGVSEKGQSFGSRSGEPMNGKMIRYGLDGGFIESVVIEHECLYGVVSGDRRKIVLWGASRDGKAPICREFDLENLCLAGEPWRMSSEHRLAGMNHDASRWIAISRSSDPVSGRLVVLDGKTRETVGTVPGTLQAIQPIVVGDTVIALTQDGDSPRWHLQGWDMNGKQLWASEPLLSNRFIVDGADSQNLLAFTHYPDS